MCWSLRWYYAHGSSAARTGNLTAMRAPVHCNASWDIRLPAFTGLPLMSFADADLTRSGHSIGLNRARSLGMSSLSPRRVR